MLILKFGSIRLVLIRNVKQILPAGSKAAARERGIKGIGLWKNFSEFRIWKVITFLSSGTGAACFRCGDCWGLHDDVTVEEEQEGGLEADFCSRLGRLRGDGPKFAALLGIAAAMVADNRGESIVAAWWFGRLARNCENANKVDGSGKENGLTCGKVAGRVTAGLVSNERAVFISTGKGDFSLLKI